MSLVWSTGLAQSVSKTVLLFLYEFRLWGLGWGGLGMPTAAFCLQFQRPQDQYPPFRFGTVPNGSTDGTSAATTPRHAHPHGQVQPALGGGQLTSLKMGWVTVLHTLWLSPMCLPERPKVGTVRLGCLVGLLGRGRVSQKWTPTRAQGCSWYYQGSALPPSVGYDLLRVFRGPEGRGRGVSSGAESPLASLKRREVGFPSPREGLLCIQDPREEKALPIPFPLGGGLWALMAQIPIRPRFGAPHLA